MKKRKSLSLYLIGSTILLMNLCIMSSGIHAQSAMHQWKYYVNSSKGNDIAALNNSIYVAFENGLYEFDAINKEGVLWSVTNYLSDIYISKIFTDKNTNRCWIGYKNGNIDFMTGSTVTNIPYLKMSDKMGDKSIVSFQTDTRFTYAAISFGILKIDPVKKEIKDTYYPPLNGNKIKDLLIYGDSIYALSDSILYSANINNPLLSSENNWKKIVFSKNTLKRFHIQQKEMFIETSSNLLLKQSSSNWVFVNEGYFSDQKSFDNLIALEEGWATTGYDGIQLIDNQFNDKKIIYRYDGITVPRPQSIIKHLNKYWIADRECGLVEWSDNFNSIVHKINFLPKSSVFSVGYHNGQVGITSGVISKTGFQYNNDGVYVNHDGNTWKLYDRYNQTKWKNKLVFDISSISFNPKKKGEFAVGSNSFVPVSISKDGKQIDTIFMDSNSTLDKSILDNGFTFITDLSYDKDGNLWVVNPFSSNVLKVYTSLQTWSEVSTGSSTLNAWATKIKIDYLGNKWIVFPGIGVVGVNTGKTPENTLDDITRVINDGEGSGALPSKDVNAVAIDFDNNLWIGTDEGFAVLYNAPGILDKNGKPFVSQRIKLKYEGNVEYLLGKTAISDIEIDGGNRKWIATKNAGLFLLCADGNQLIASFTKENSGLISNNINDIQFNHQTGELFIVTDLGLVSYRADASEGTIDYESTVVFPNPYKTEHSKGITIQGIKYDSDVKITDAAGNVVYKTTSNGGTAFWNAQDWNGNRVSPGVYFFWTAPNAIEVEGKKVGKVVVF